MGSIKYIHPKKYWIILNEGILKCNEEIGVEVEIGEWDDYITNGIITVWMNKKVYEKIMNGEYSFIPQAYSNPAIKVLNKNKQEVDLLSWNNDGTYKLSPAPFPSMIVVFKNKQFNNLNKYA